MEYLSSKEDPVSHTRLHFDHTSQTGIVIHMLREAA
jgi:hypothetical protein